MSKTKVLMMMAVACWFAAGSIPLHAQAQIVADGAGVTVNLNGSQLMHRTPVTYPAEALANGVEGTVVVQVRLDPNGEVTDDAVLSGPDELRKSVQQSVLNWHFDIRAGSATRVVNIDFVKPANAPVVPVIVRSSDPVPERTATQVRVMTVPQAPAPRSGTIDQIDVTGLSDTATAGLLAQLPVHAGDPFTSDTVIRAAEAARQFDSHLIVGMSSGPSGANVMTIRPQGALQAVISAAPPAPNLAVPPGAAVIASNVEASNLINAVRPVYPPLAKMARQQGSVKFQATIGKDGAMEDLQLISGPPLLVQSAMDAVKKWTYRPMVLNGAPVQVVTTIDVNFSLTE
jgi:TonB family protein